GCPSNAHRSGIREQQAARSGRSRPRAAATRITWAARTLRPDRPRCSLGGPSLHPSRALMKWAEATATEPTTVSSTPVTQGSPRTAATLRPPRSPGLVAGEPAHEERRPFRGRRPPATTVAVTVPCRVREAQAKPRGGELDLVVLVRSVVP